MQHAFDTPGPTSLHVELGSGSLTVVTGDVATTTIDVTGDDAADVVIDRHDEEITVRAPLRRGGFLAASRDLDVRVSLPHDSRLTTKLGSADLEARGRLGQVALKAGSGDVELELVSGDALVETGSGDVHIGEVAGELRLKSGSGDVRVDRTGGSASLATGSGDIRVGVCADAVQLKSGSGDALVVEAHHDVAMSTASGDITVERLHRGELRASNVSGDISIGVPEGVAVWTDISTVTGSVTSGLVRAGAPAEGQEHVELYASTVSGDVHLEHR